MFCLLAECFLTNLSPSCRTVTHLSIRLHSRDTHTSSTCCYTMEHPPMNTLLLVHTGEYYDIHSKYFDSVSWPLLVDPNDSSSFDFLIYSPCLSIYFFVQNGNSALSIARRLGYISVVDTLKVVTEETLTTQVRLCFWECGDWCV